MSEIAPAGGGPNRLFIVLAIGLAALLVIGLVGLGGFFVIQNVFRPGAAPTARVAIATPSRPAAAETAPAAPTQVATPTLVLSGSGGQPIAQIATATAEATATPDTSGQLPQSGLGEDLLLVAGGVVLVAVIFAARRVRTA